MAPKTIPYQTMLGKVGEMMTLARTITNLHIPDKVFLSASFLPKWSPRRSLPRPCWEKLEKWCPLSGPSILQRFLISFCRGVAFSKMLPKTTPCQTMLGKVGGMVSLARTITDSRIPDKVFLLALLFSKWPQGQSLTRPCWEKLEYYDPCQDHHESTYSW